MSGRAIGALWCIVARTAWVRFVRVADHAGGEPRCGLGIARCLDEGRFRAHGRIWLQSGGPRRSSLCVSEGVGVGVRRFCCGQIPGLHLVPLHARRALLLRKTMSTLPPFPVHTREFWASL